MSRESIEDILKEIGSGDVPAEVRKIAQEKSRDFSETLMRPGQHIFLEYIMKSQITKLAAVAVIIIAIILGMYTLVGDGTSTVFAEMIENMKEMPWLYAVRRGRSGSEGLVGEYWYSFQSNIKAERDFSGKVSYFDFPNRTKTIYNPKTNTAVISFLPDGNKDFFFWLESPMLIVERMIKTFQEQGAMVKRESDQYEGIGVYIYRLTMSDEYHGKANMKLIADRYNNLLRIWEVKSWSPQGELITDAEIKVDYPEQGPKDIYELGVPKTAKVLDNSPTTDLLEILKTYQACRDEVPTQYIMILSRLTSAKIFYNDNQQQRMERFHIYEPDKFFAQKQQEMMSEKGDTFDSQFKWWTSPSISDYGIQLGHIEIYDGKYHYRLELSSEGWVVADKQHPSRKPTLGQDLVRLGWPKHPLSTTYKVTQVAVLEDGYSKSHNFICIQMLLDGLRLKNKITRLPAKWRFYLNPERDFICNKHEFVYQLDAPWQSDPTWLDGIDLENVEKDSSYISEVLEYGRTDSGKWHPKKIEHRRLWLKEDGTTAESTNIEAVYIEENPKFPQGIFDHRSLPKADK